MLHLMGMFHNWLQINEIVVASIKIMFKNSVTHVINPLNEK